MREERGGGREEREGGRRERGEGGERRTEVLHVTSSYIQLCSKESFGIHSLVNVQEKYKTINKFKKQSKFWF